MIWMRRFRRAIIDRGCNFFIYPPDTTTARYYLPSRFVGGQRFTLRGFSLILRGTVGTGTEKPALLIDTKTQPSQMVSIVPSMLLPCGER